MKAVVLAAGLGSRLGDITVSVPKPLVSVAGRPLVMHTLDALAVAGIDRPLIVTGYREELVQDALRGSLKVQRWSSFRTTSTGGRLHPHWPRRAMLAARNPSSC